MVARSSSLRRNDGTMVAENPCDAKHSLMGPARTGWGPTSRNTWGRLSSISDLIASAKRTACLRFRAPVLGIQLGAGNDPPRHRGVKGERGRTGCHALERLQELVANRF